VTTALRFYATNDIQQVDGDLVGISQASVSRIVKRVTIAICHLRPDFINFPNEFQQIKQNFANIAGFPEVIGAIDGTHVPIESPGGQDAELFRNRKGFFSLNVQAIVDSTGKFNDIVVRWPGATNDSTIFNNSRICQRFENNEFDGLLIGDSGYACRNYLLTPILNPTTPGQRRYNYSHIATRGIVERTFGRWKKRFRCLLTPLRLALETSQNVIVATACLHNMSIMQRIPEPPEINDPVVLPMEPHPDHDYVANFQRRNEIVRDFFD
jgi:hypothetical protein